MTSHASLTGSHQRTYNTIFQHPISHNLKWHDVHALFRHLGEVQEESNGNLKVTIKGKVLILRPVDSKDVSDADELMTLRRFIQLYEKMPDTPEGETPYWLVVIDHKAARIFRSEMPGAFPQQVLPHEPSEYFRQAHNSETFSRGKEKPDPNSFFEPIVKALGAEGSILIFGAGTGTSSEMEQLIAWLKVHHPDVVKRIAGSLVVDESHLSEGQLLAKAREFHKDLKVVLT